MYQSSLLILLPYFSYFCLLGFSRTSQYFTGIGKSTVGQMLAEIIPFIFHYISINEISAKAVSTQLFRYVEGQYKKGEGISPILLIDIPFRLSDNTFTSVPIQDWIGPDELYSICKNRFNRIISSRTGVAIAI